jgi:hypothetical protein
MHLTVDRDMHFSLTLHVQAESIAKGSKNPGNQMTQNLKWEIKASRTMGMHVSPTTTINGTLAKGDHPIVRKMYCS